ncbi:MAG: hypothetical protein WBQ43_09210 [Terriglobales bacterium]
MKHTKCMAIATLLLLAVCGVAAQSLGDYARTARKNKPEPNSASRHYDNDNLPTGEALNVIGPPPPAEGKPGDANSADAADAAAADRQKSADERQKAADEWKKKLDDQKKKVDSLNHEIDLDQREMRLRAAAAYTDPNIVVRDVNWNKDDLRYKNEIDQKQKALDTARQELNDLQDQAHKAGVAEEDKDKDSKDTDQDKNK